MNAKVIIEKGIPMAVGLCSCAVVEGLLKQHVPCKEEILSKIARRVGIFGIGCVVSSMVTEQVESEVSSIMEIIEPLVEACKKDEPATVKNVEERDIPFTYLSTDQDGDTEANVYVSSRIEDVEKRQEELRAMADDIREKLKVSVTDQDIPKEEANGGSTEA